MPDYLSYPQNSFNYSLRAVGLTIEALEDFMIYNTTYQKPRGANYRDEIAQVYAALRRANPEPDIVFGIDEGAAAKVVTQALNAWGAS